MQPDALLVNYKSIDLQFIPEEDSGTVRIVSLPDLAPISIINQLALGAGGCDFWPERPATSLVAPQLVFTGVLGEYLGAVLDEVRARPHYIVEERINLPPAERDAS